jgi:hypothetical protein
MGEFYNRFDAEPVTMGGIVEAKVKLDASPSFLTLPSVFKVEIIEPKAPFSVDPKRLARYWRRKAARAGTRGRRGALSEREVNRRYLERCRRVVDQFLRPKGVPIRALDVIRFDPDAAVFRGEDVPANPSESCHMARKSAS